MIELYKKRGETPLEALNRLRDEQSELEKETLSYAGRLDPMAEGILPVLVGEEENKNRKLFLNYDKEYHAEFLIGVSTDTGDVLGVIQKNNFKHIDANVVLKEIEQLTQLTSQIYPWYSSKTVKGVPLFEYARKGELDIKRPFRDITIYSVKDIKVSTTDIHKLIQEIIIDIEKVKGDFRQEEIIEGWKGLDSYQCVGDDCDNDGCENGFAILASCTLCVSSGTYIRGLCDVLEKRLGVPVVLHKLVRTKVRDF